ncbi:hypothetical protein GCM10011584_07520 [Nocardioides phosphati]|uniref:DUF2214 domain-containing protein n=1 Tax=Nocardioides phosphati TaxID=1867775 RepID=A0ABQ2N8M1_9ACTN|nr:hypothetical protein [Nocardioides phosphati]GGO86064.1 hypothetical protein GCM10011584_07520 [Nocardioides phosphati]
MTMLDTTPIPSESSETASPILGATRAGVGRTVMLGVALVGAWAASIAGALTLETSHNLHMCALFLHLGCLIAGFGAVMTLDWFGLLWLSGRRALADVLDVADAAHPLIWMGLLGLAATGMLLEPSLTPLTCVKLGAVLLVAINGLNAMRLNHAMGRLDRDPDRPMMVWSAVTVSLSQLGWWTACLIGFLNAH